VALVLFACASAYAVQGVGFNQNAHYALVQALTHGTPVIDRYRGTTADVSHFHGHYYANKAPGLAFVDLPVYAALRAVRIAHTGPVAANPSRTDIAVIWLLGLWSALLPALALLVLVARAADEVEPGYGVAAAATLAGATMILPFSELLFAHSLSAVLGFASFVLLRRRRPALAGLAGGLAVCVEYPLAIVALLLCAYAARGGLRRALEYVAGAAAGLVPLALYDWWAFGSPTHLSYRDAVLPATHTGFFGLGRPSADALGDLLFSSVGLLVITPVVALGAAALVPLWRRGQRAEAALFAAIAICFLLYTAGFVTPIGVESPGGRSLRPVVPVVAVPLTIAWRSWPLVYASLAAASAVYMSLLTSTGATRASTGRSTSDFVHGHFVSTLGSYAGVPRAAAIIPWFALLGLAGCFAVRRLPTRHLLAVPLALGAWLAVALVGPRVFTSPEIVNQHPRFTPLVIAAIAVLAVAAKTRWSRAP
jgi:hypothetical protein